MNEFHNFLTFLRQETSFPSAWIASLEKRVEQNFNPQKNRDLGQWLTAIELLPKIDTLTIDLTRDTILVGQENEISQEQRAHIERQLRVLHPWRKGPFSVFGIFIDTEWRSDWKWNRLKDAIQPLAGRAVLDVGSGNGYHCLRMAGAGARVVLGIDPYLKNVAQFLALQKFIRQKNTTVLPLALEEVSPAPLFDTVFSMGVLYHRRSPFDHLLALKNLLKPAGELVLETLVIEGELHKVLVPQDRYAKMRNVWFIPSPPTLEAWLERAGFTRIRLMDVTETRTEEQHSTDWMRFESLPDFLDPNDNRLTVEGYPRPRRAIFLARKP